MRAAHRWTLVVVEPGPCQRVQYVVHRVVHVASAVCVLDTEDETSRVLPSEQEIVECRAEPADVEQPCGAWCEAHADVRSGRHELRWQ